MRRYKVVWTLEFDAKDTVAAKGFLVGVAEMGCLEVENYDHPCNFTVDEGELVDLGPIKEEGEEDA